jgi:hypothetical protein
LDRSVQNGLYLDEAIITLFLGGECLRWSRGRFPRSRWWLEALGMEKLQDEVVKPLQGQQISEASEVG